MEMTSSRVYWVAACLPDGRAVVGMLVVVEPRPTGPAEVIDLGATPARRTLRGEVRALPERSAA